MAETTVGEDSKDLPTCLCCGIKPNLGFFVVQKLLLGCWFFVSDDVAETYFKLCSNATLKFFVVVVSLLRVHLFIYTLLN
jgi:hypothetical protein